MSGRLVFSPGETQKTFLVSITQDGAYEPDEDFRVSFVGVQNVYRGDGAQISIADDDQVIVK